MHSYEIRPLNAQDIPQALALAWQVFLQFDAPDYTEEGIAEFERYIQIDSIQSRNYDGDLLLWGCWEGCHLIGMTALEPPAHLSLLFVDEAHHRHGAAKALCQAAVNFAQGRSSVLSVNASIYAAEAYRRMGFKDIGEECTVKGLRYIPMKKPLI